MKYKLTIAIVVLIILVVGGILEEIFIADIFNDFSESIDDILARDGTEYDYDEIKKLHEWWSKRHQYLELFLPHIQLNEIEITYGELLGAVEADDMDSATALLNRIKATSDALCEMFAFRLGNIL